DFYWVEQVGGKTVFAAVDCTGHGVPGAFMSLGGHNGLNQVVKERRRADPALVLDQLNRVAYHTLHKDRGQYVRDGMDIALCVFNPDTLALEYAGANCPLYVVREGEVLQFTANKMPIGGFELKDRQFLGHTVQLRPGDAAYVFSDGYADQFGGPRGKKFRYRQFRELLVQITPETAERKKALLGEAFMQWRGTQEQVDDILVMGMQV